MDYVLHSDDAFTLVDFMSAKECRSHIARSESVGYEAAEIDSGRGSVLDSQIRNNDRVLLSDSSLAHDLWLRMKDYLPRSLGEWRPSGLNQKFRYYRYQPGARFNWHRDGAYESSPDERSRMTFMIYLNSDFSGGETDFGEFAVKPVQGSALCFPHPLVHEGCLVTAGTKYVLRTDVMFRR